MYAPGLAFKYLRPIQFRIEFGLVQESRQPRGVHGNLRSIGEQFLSYMVEPVDAIDAADELRRLRFSQALERVEICYEQPTVRTFAVIPRQSAHRNTKNGDVVERKVRNA